MPLTDASIRTAKPADKPRKMADSGGLYLIVTPSGGKWWRYKYRFGGKEKLLAFGTYPEVSLKEARERRDEARKLLSNGADPGAVKQAQKVEAWERTANMFEAVAGRWFEVWRTGVAENTAEDQWTRLKTHVFPCLGDVSVSDISAPKVLAVLKPLESRGTGSTLRKTREAISQIMRFATQYGLAQGDPVPSLRGAFKAASGKHMAAILDKVKLGQLLRDIDAYEARHMPVKAALRLLPLVFVRPGELRAAKWAEIDLDAGVWKYFVTKTKVEHLVPLAGQAVAILRELHLITGGNRHGFVFPGLNPGRIISNITLNSALRSMGYDTKTEITGHGFRAVARTLLAEELGFDPLVIEHQLAHRVPDTLGTAYNRTKYLKQRREMMQSWADYFDRLKAGADVIPLHGHMK
jgi:integrase